MDRLTIEDCTLSARGTPSNLSGIVISNSTVAIVRSMLNYFRITQPRGQGGAIHRVYNYVLISNSMFFMNSAHQGGVVYCLGSTILINNSTFTNNTAGEGGVLYIKRDGNSMIITITSCTFKIAY